MPGTCSVALDISFFLIPPITTMSPSPIRSFVVISILFIPTAVGSVLSGVSLFTCISKSMFPSPIILGVTVSFKAASLNVVGESPLPGTGICTP
ncbi:uncharacterized protein METZ01_LOCUS384274 [marine metagenome]|uniref:Uncharacterized protein n=1 Tax=marine metagenome TaxID=408172 RepID=A0A382UAW6_9ZZZZ